jgi:hypothetical protein
VFEDKDFEIFTGKKKKKILSRVSGSATHMLNATHLNK